MATIADGAARHPAVGALHLALGDGLHGLNEDLGEERVGITRLGGADGAGQHAHADQEGLLVTDEARAIQRFLEVVGTFQLRGNNG